MTGLYNHVTFQHKVTDMFESFPGENSALLYHDIDDFKHINDAFGHYAGMISCVMLL
ncbi:MAG: diguanylate cyclase domain-containing protein [Coprococcus sp.]